MVTTTIILSLFNLEIFLYLGLLLILLYLILILYGVFSSTSNLFLKTIKGKEYFKEKDGVLFSFDDGPEPEYTPLILDILKKHQIKAIFFVTGEKAEKYPELLKRSADEGHLIGNHSYSHSCFTNFFSYKKLFEEVEKTNSIIESITGMRPKYYRPPMGFKNQILKKVMDKTNMQVMIWDIRTHDTKFTANAIMKVIRSKLRNRVIILFHDGIYKLTRNDRKNTVEVLEEVIKTEVPN